MRCTSAKKILDKINNVYEGCGKVKGVKLQTYIRQFEHLEMKEDEDIVAYFLWFDEILNTLRGLGEKDENSSLVQKILSCL
jgi:hypothetical protein